MSLDTSLVDIDSIEINQNFPALNDSHIEHLANKIAAAGELLEIPVVLFLDIDRYELLSNFAAYKALIKAREINPDLPDSIRVFIAKDSNKAVILDQINEFNSLSSANFDQEVLPHQVVSEAATGTPPPSNIELEVRNLSESFKRFSNKLSNQQDGIQTTLTELLDAQPKPLPILEALNQIDRPVIYQRLVEAITRSSGFTSQEKKKYRQVVETAKSLKEKNADLEFNSLSDFLEKLGQEAKSHGRNRDLTEYSLIKLIDQWPL